MLRLAGFLVLEILAVERDVEVARPARDHLRNAVRIAVAPAQNTRHVAHHRLRRERAKGDDLRHRALAVFLPHILDHFTAPLLAEIHVDVWRGDTLRIEKPLEKEFELDRVDVGDAHQVGDHRAGCGTAPRTDGDASRPRPRNEVPDDQEIVHESLRLQQPQLALQPFRDDGIFHRALAVALAQTLVADGAQILVLPHPVFRRVVRVFRNAELDLQITPLGDGESVVARLREVTKQVPHFRRILHVKLGQVMHAALVRDARAGADADQHVVRFVRFASQEMHVIRGHQSDAEILRHLRQQAIDFELLLHAVVLHFEEEVLRPEDVAISRRQFPAFRLLIEHDRVRHFAFEAAAEADKPFRMRGEQLFVDPRLVIHAVEMRDAHELQQVVITRGILRQQREVIRRFLAA